MRTKALSPEARAKLLLLSNETSLRKLAKQLDVDPETLGRAALNGALRQATRKDLESKLLKEEQV